MLSLKCPNCGYIAQKVFGDVTVTLQGGITPLEGDGGITMGMVPGAVVSPPTLLSPSEYTCPNCNVTNPAKTWEMEVRCLSCNDLITAEGCEFCDATDSAEQIVRNHFCRDIGGCLCTRHALRTEQEYCHDGCRHRDRCQLLTHINRR